MSKTPASMSASALARPYADSFATSTNANPTSWVCIDVMPTEHHTTGFTGSKRLTPGSFAGVLT